MATAYRLGSVNAPTVAYRPLALALLFVWGVLDTATTHALVAIGAHDSHPVVRWLLEAGMVEFWAFKLASAGLLGVFLLGIEEYVVEDPEHPYVGLAFAYLLAIAVLAVLVLGPVTHLYVWANNGFAVVGVLA